MKFLVDANLPPGFASWLRGFGHEAIYVMDIVGLTQDDRAIFDHVGLHDLIIVTKDEDFALLTTLFRRSPKVVGFVWAMPPTLRCGWLDPMLPEIVQRLTAGERLYRGRVIG